MTNRRLRSRPYGRSPSCTRVAGDLSALAWQSSLCAMPALAAAQDTRAESIAAEQAEKAAHLAPARQHRGEALLIKFRRAARRAALRLLSVLRQRLQRRRLHARRGLSPLHRRSHPGGASPGLYSVKGYKLIEASGTSPGHLVGSPRSARHRAAGVTRRRWRITGSASTAPPTSTPRSACSRRSRAATRRCGPHRWLRLTAATAYEDYTLKDPTGDLVSVEDVFTPDTAPGVGVDPAYLHTTASAAFDWRPAADYARRGGLYRVARHHYADRDDTYSFDRLDAEVVQHIPILRENWVISLRGRLESTLGRRRSGAVLPAAVARQRQHAARLQQLALPRSPRDARVRRVAMDPQSPGARHGVLLRHRHGRAPPRRDRAESFVNDFGVGIALSRAGADAAPRRARARRRRPASGVRRERGVLIMSTSTTTPGATGPLRAPGREPGAARRRRAAFLRRRSARARARHPGCLEGAGVGHRSVRRSRDPTCSAVPAIRRPTCARATSTRSTRCRTRAGSPIAS